MPYTPPSHRSPASSVVTSPEASRRPSLQTGSRPSLPRSASYLTKHRRTPSVSAISDGTASPLTPQATEEDLPAMIAALSTGSVRKSPPPITNGQGMPAGAIISPPDSASSGSDDDAPPEIRGRRTERLKDLRDSVSQISQDRSSSPVRNNTNKEEEEEEEKEPERRMHASFSTSALSDMPNGRKISHIRASTEPNASNMMSGDNSSTGSDDDTDGEIGRKPQMLRKKSGELVRPALRTGTHRRPSSMPGTPVYSKAVHFDSHLEHVRHFLQVDRPLAVSAGSSPVDVYDSDTEYPFPNTTANPSSRSPPFEWELITSNFPQDSHSRKSSPVRLEKVWFSSDQKTLMGSVAVANLAFHKNVACRFTLDYWKTTSEVVAEYSHEIKPKETATGHDRFTFSIKLSDMANLESKTLFFCVRFIVDAQEFWDNNSQANFQVDFRKKHLPQNGKNNFQGAGSRPSNGLPRSNRRQSPAGVPRPKSMPAGFGELADNPKFNFDQPIHAYLGETDDTAGLRLKTKSNNNLASDNLDKGLGAPSGVAFANRYDFGASLTAAVQAAKDSMSKDKDTLYMKSNVRAQPSLAAPKSGSPAIKGSPSNPGSHSPSQSLPNLSYDELVSKYCFYGNKQLDSPQAGFAEHIIDNSTNTTVSKPKDLPQLITTEPSPSPNAVPRATQVHDSNPYFTTAGFSSSPASSPAGSMASTPKSLASRRTNSPGFTIAVSQELPFHPSQQVVSDRFPWGGEAHAQPIRG